MAENENLASILVKSGLNSIFTDSPIGYFSKFANEQYASNAVIALKIWSALTVWTNVDSGSQHFDQKKS